LSLDHVIRAYCRGQLLLEVLGFPRLDGILKYHR
jgi:hypothetical protein